MGPACLFRFTSGDGLSIACARWEGRGPMRGVLQIAHGMGEHVGRYAALIDALISAGITVYGNDHRGHGRTAGPSAPRGEFGTSGFDSLVEDMLRLSRIARNEHPGAKLVLLGHSMGSFAAQQYVLDHSGEIDGLILSGSGTLDGLARLVSSGQVGTGLLNAAFEPVRTPFDWLSRDAAVVDAFMADPLCFAELAPAAYASFLAAAPRLSDPACLRDIRRDLPIYVFSGSEDPVGQRLEGVRVLLERYREAGLFDLSHDFCPGGRHEMLNEINRAEVQTRLLGWVSSVLERRGPAAS